MPDGTPLSGGFQGAPGLDPQVRDQGSNHALSYLAAFSLSLLLAIGSGCATAKAPKYGSIFYHDPGSVLGTRSTRKNPVTLSYLSEAPKVSAPDSNKSTDPQDEDGDAKSKKPKSKQGAEAEDAEGVDSFVGSRGWNPDAQLPGMDRQSQKKRTQFRSSIPIRMDPIEFAELWQTFDEVGLFELQQFRGSPPPASAAYFEFESDGVSRVYLNPEINLRSAISDQDRDRIRAWRRSKEVIVTGHYSH